MDLVLSHIVKDTYSNSSGYSLYVILKDYFENNKPISISFKDATPTSSSFLNSSFGALIEEYGLNTFVQLVKPTALTKGHATVLKKYISTFKVKEGS